MLLTISDLENLKADELASAIVELLTNLEPLGIFTETLMTSDHPQIVERIAALDAIESVALAEQICKLLRIRLESEMAIGA